MIFTSSNTLEDDVKAQLRDLYTNSKIEFRDADTAHLNDEYVFGMERAGRVLRFITTTEEFYEWLHYVLASIWGPKPFIDENFSLFNLPDELLALKYSSGTMCPEIPPELADSLTYDRQGRFNMESSYLMGARLVVHNAK